MQEWPVIRLLAFDHALTLAPWCVVRRGSTPALRTRRIAHELEQAEIRPPAAWEAALAQLLYLPLSFRQILLAWWPECRGVLAHYGVGPLRQLRDLLRLTWRGNLPPRVYYHQRLFRLRDPATHLIVVEHREVHVLQRALHAGVDVSVLEDKIVFHAFCQKHGLPTPPVLAAYANGKPLFPTATPSAWQADLFCKPARSYASQGVSSWRYDAAADRYTDRDQTFDLAGLQSWLAEQSRDQVILVQPCIANAPDLLPITGAVLANCRVVTGRRTDGSIAVLLGSFRIAWQGTIASDEILFCAGVNLATGVLHAAETKIATQGAFHHHPQSGAPIAGYTLRRWPEMRALTVRAHTALPEIVFVGWDVIDTDRGPMLLEANLMWGGNLAQMSGNPPLGMTEFPTIFLDRYAQRPPGIEDNQHDAHKF